MQFKDLVGKTLVKVEGGTQDEEYFYLTDSNGQCYHCYHSRDCCESVSITKKEGNIDDILNSPILEAHESNPDYPYPHQYPDSYTWTEQVIRTEKGKVIWLWLGESNGYYGETPYFCLSHQSY